MFKRNPNGSKWLDHYNLQLKKDKQLDDLCNKVSLTINRSFGSNLEELLAPPKNGTLHNSIQSIIDFIDSDVTSEEAEKSDTVLHKMGRFSEVTSQLMSYHEALHAYLNLKMIAEHEAYARIEAPLVQENEHRQSSSDPLPPALQKSFDKINQIKTRQEVSYPQQSSLNELNCRVEEIISQHDSDIKDKFKQQLMTFNQYISQSVAHHPVPIWNIAQSSQDTQLSKHLNSVRKMISSSLNENKVSDIVVGDRAEELNKNILAVIDHIGLDLQIQLQVERETGNKNLASTMRNYNTIDALRSFLNALHTYIQNEAQDTNNLKQKIQSDPATYDSQQKKHSKAKEEQEKLQEIEKSLGMLIALDKTNGELCERLQHLTRDTRPQGFQGNYTWHTLPLKLEESFTTLKNSMNPQRLFEKQLNDKDIMSNIKYIDQSVETLINLIPDVAHDPAVTEHYIRSIGCYLNAKKLYLDTTGASQDDKQEVTRLNNKLISQLSGHPIAGSVMECHVNFTVKQYECTGLFKAAKTLNQACTQDANQSLSLGVN